LGGKTAVITGASSGIGRALALELGRRGCPLALVARRRGALEEVAQAVEGEAHIFPCDVREREQVHAAARKVLETFSRVDLLILSAGIGLPTEALELDAAHVEEVFKTNLFGVVYWIEALLPHLREQGGLIVGLSSLASYRGLPRSAAYCASKAALTTFLEGLRVDLRRRGSKVRVLTIAPGYVRTPMTAGRGRLPFLIEPEEAARRILRGIERERPLLRFPWQLSLLVRLIQVLPPRMYDELIARWAR